ncbi:MAG: PAS domain-containing sensor histidine kinase, partial [Cyanobacteria bacterium]|nr:PAS domain-containing sensor histidine kinase [Cyanobacteriota bacterium]
ELTAVREDGTLFPVEISCNGIQFKGGVLHLVAMLDVTERHEIERMKREFVAMVSHDLRTPLSSVQGMLALLSAGAAGNLPARAGSIVETAEGQLERLISLINDLLDIQKMESGRFQIERDEVLVKDLLDQSLEAVEQVAKAAKVEFSLPETNARMIADGARIIQVLVNLFSNAIKFSPADGSVEVTVIESPTEVEFRVEDHGRGIPPEHIDAVFERFRQVEPGDAKEKKGTGLGLAICKMIVEGHGGTIGVRSEPGKGSTFWFKIPVH